MKCSFAILLFSSFSSELLAEEWNLRPGELQLNYEQVTELTTNRTLNFFNNGQSKYSVGGAYSHSFPDEGGTQFGVFDVRRDGRVCVNFRNGENRCNLYLKSHGLLLMLTEEGDRFPVKLEFELN